MFSARNLTIAILALAGAAAGAAGWLAWRRDAAVAVDPRFATPQATLDSYVKAVLAVDVRGEMDCGIPELQEKMDRDRGTDPKTRRDILTGKSQVFRESPISAPIRSKVWGEVAKILVTQGGSPSNPITYVYTFKRLPEGWKISRIERTSDINW